MQIKNNTQIFLKTFRTFFDYEKHNTLTDIFLPTTYMYGIFVRIVKFRIVGNSKSFFFEVKVLV